MTSYIKFEGNVFIIWASKINLVITPKGMYGSKLAAKKSKKRKASDDISSDEYDERRVIFVFTYSWPNCVRLQKLVSGKWRQKRKNKALWTSMDLIQAAKVTPLMNKQTGTEPTTFLWIYSTLIE